MAEGRIKDAELSAIAAAIRTKNGESTAYKPAEMAQAILDIPSGTTPTGTVNITQNGTTDVTQYASAAVNVPNSYSAGDEGKVVSNGALVAQAARSSEITANGTYDTTLNDEVTVNVSGGGGGASWATITPTVYNASYIDSSSGLAIDNPNWPSYRIIALDLNEFSGKLIQIDNRANDRNWWGLFSSVSQGQAIVWPDVRQSESSKTLTFFADDFLRLSNYLVYDFTTSNQDPPIVKMLTP